MNCTTRLVVIVAELSTHMRRFLHFYAIVAEPSLRLAGRNRWEWWKKRQPKPAATDTGTTSSACGVFPSHAFGNGRRFDKFGSRRIERQRIHREDLDTAPRVAGSIKWLRFRPHNPETFRGLLPIRKHPFGFRRPCALFVGAYQSLEDFGIASSRFREGALSDIFPLTAWSAS